MLQMTYCKSDSYSLRIYCPATFVVKLTQLQLVGQSKMVAMVKIN